MALKENLSGLFDEAQLGALKAHAENLVDTSGLCNHPIECSNCYINKSAGSMCTWNACVEDSVEFLRWFKEDYVGPEEVAIDPELLMKDLLEAKSLLLVGGNCGALQVNRSCSKCIIGRNGVACTASNAKEYCKQLLLDHTDVELVVPEDKITTPPALSQLPTEWRTGLDVKVAQEAYDNGFLVTNNNWSTHKRIHKD